MIHTIGDFAYEWSLEIEATQKVFKHMTDKSLHTEIAPGTRSLGRLAWHITTTISEMMSKTGLHIPHPDPESPVPSSAKEIFQTYGTAAIVLLDQVKSQWTDATLQIVDEMYGQKWKRSQTLGALIKHQIHHRAQMTVLMRIQGLSVPGIYGPTREEWAHWGMQPPRV